jgi:hypothetical protein
MTDSARLRRWGTSPLEPWTPAADPARLADELLGEDVVLESRAEEPLAVLAFSGAD